MNFLNSAIFSIALAVSSVGYGQEGSFDHERLTTKDGRVFLEIFVIGSDFTGLTFRHREGIAKVDFTRLSDAYRMLYEGLESLDDPKIAGSVNSRERGSGDEENKNTPDSVHGGIDELENGPVNLTARNRVVVNLPHSVWWIGAGVDRMVPVPSWPSWWPQHEEVHRLTYPLYRELAVRNFLHSSGLLQCARIW